MEIKNFEITNYGRVTLSTYKDGREIKHEYHSVPKKLILKLLQAKSAPDMEDFAKWVKDTKENDNKKYAIAVEDFWSAE